MAKGRARKRDLIKEMRLENPITEEEVGIVSSGQSNSLIINGQWKTVQ